MATVHRFPVFLWRCPQGKIAAYLLDDHYAHGTAVAETEREALEMLKEYLTTSGKDGSFHYMEPDFKDPETRRVKISIIPEYRADSRTYPCKGRIAFNLPCVIGKREGGMLTASLPTLDLTFDYHTGDDFERIARHYVGYRLSGLTPQQLSRHLPPAEVWLKELAVTMREKPRAYDDDDRYEQLTAIAEPIGARDWRRVGKTWEREDEVATLASYLSEERSSVCLIGDPGCGKTSVLVEAARQIERESRGKGRAPKIFWMTSAAKLVAGMRFLGQWEERLEEAIASLSSIPGILCVENLLDLVKAGGTEAETSIAAFLAPYLESGELRLVTEATADEISACERLLPGLIDRFHHLPLAGFTPAAQTRLLHRAANYFDVTEGIRFPESAAERAGALFERFQPHAAFPGKVFDFLSRLADRSADGDSPEITSKSAEILFSETTGLPSELVAEDAAAFEVDKVATFLEAKLVGQGRAVSAVARSLAKFGTGLNDPTRPLGVFLFCGPTGVGKTQMVRRLGDFIFPGKPERERLIRLDMSEYAGYDAPARLLGDIGGAPSELLRHIRASPFSVVLLDEIEKADPSVFDVLLGMFDEGRLTDAFGRTTSFCSSWIIMTSNLGAGAAAPMGFGTGDADELAAKTGFDPDAAAKFFRPEFFNRIDQTVVFDPLNRSGIKEVTRRELVEVAAREGLAERGLTLSYDDTLVTALAKAGFDPTYGARPLQRAIDAAVTAPLARHLVRNPDLRDAQLNLSWDAEKASIRINAPLPAG